MDQVHVGLCDGFRSQGRGQGTDILPAEILDEGDFDETQRWR